MGMRFPAVIVLCALVLALVACGEKDETVTVTPATAPPTKEANGMPSVLPPEIIEITSTEQFDAEIAKPRPDAVVIADFHAEWCLPCRKLGPELVEIALAHPGKFFVLRVDFDQHPKLVDRFQVETLPLLVKFKDGKETARQVGIEKDKGKFAGWLGIR